MTLSSSMNIAKNALMVNQAAINVVSNNISNMNTEGYSRLRVDLSEVINPSNGINSVYSQIAQLGGVQIDNITRYADEYLQSYYRSQNTDLEYFNTASTVGASVESIMNELKETGIEALLSKFYEAANNLNQNPTDSTARINFVEQSKLLATRFNDLSTSLSNLQTSLVGTPTGGNMAQSSLGLSVDALNTKLQNLADLNASIVKITSATSSPNSLLDQRDALLNEIATYLPVNITTNENSTVSVSLNGVDLVRGTQVRGTITALSTGDADNPIKVVFNDNQTGIVKDVTSSIDSGSIGAIIDATRANSDIVSIQDVQKGLDSLAKTFGDELNRIQKQTGAMYIDKTTMTLVQSTTPLFETKDGSTTITASNITVNQNIINDPYLVAAAKVDPATYDPKAVGDGCNMLDVAATRSTNYIDLGSNTPEGFITAIVGKIGTANGNTKTNLTNQEAVVKEITNNLSSISGINIDEELVDLIKYQRAYEASARIFNTCSDLLDTLVNLGA